MAEVVVLIRVTVKGFLASEFKFIFSQSPLCRIVLAKGSQDLSMPTSDINELYVQVRRRLIETGEWDQWVTRL